MWYEIHSSSERDFCFTLMMVSANRFFNIVGRSALLGERSIFFFFDKVENINVYRSMSTYFQKTIIGKLKLSSFRAKKWNARKRASKILTVTICSSRSTCWLTWSRPWFFLNKGYVNNLHIIDINMSIKNINILLSMLLEKRKKFLQLPW